MQIGIDFGGTKIEAAALDGNGTIVTRIRRANPGNYDDAVRAVRDLVRMIETTAGRRGTVGVGTPGSVSPTTGVMRNSNSLYLNGQRFREDLSEALMREVRLANDANCFALSEAVDGAGAGSAVVFGAILGTGCGGGLVVGGKLIAGANGIGGEWGHNPLPWPSVQENPGPSCYCGQHGCLEQWISGSGLQRDYLSHARQPMNAVDIIAQARAGNDKAENAFDRFVSRLARALATICNVVDPDVIVVGGGLSNVAEIYERLPGIIRAHVFSDAWSARIVPAQWGDSSGVRGAARLWSLEEALARKDTAFVNPK
ncbi:MULTISPECIES: ROK family protein [Asticcacaulis]|uniref:ROK family protein n=1 Tax=Asticcacaulis TaxID=76890 RepID=UPI001AE6FC77|nr:MULTISPECIES: ROK family protein [Asticcacaulis]MBP2157899.1 fructokinase [Asticcacaulis solisilvae]MDR6798944.1 fructokinase [Asticcacaulis sp. BE141]